VATIKRQELEDNEILVVGIAGRIAEVCASRRSRTQQTSRSVFEEEWENQLESKRQKASKVGFYGGCRILDSIFTGVDPINTNEDIETNPLAYA